MNLHLLRKLSQGNLPKTLTEHMEIKDAMELEACGYIDAVFQSSSKGRDTHGELKLGIVKSIKAAGLDALKRN